MRVLIATVATNFGDITEQTKKAVENLDRGDHIVDWLILTEQLSDAGDEWRVGPTVWHNLEKARRYALSEDYDYLVSLEWDIVPPPHALLTLMSDDADVAVGLYPERPTKVGSWGGKLLQCCPWNKIPNAEERVKIGAPFQITAGEAGLGYVLVSRRVLELQAFKWPKAWYDEMYEKGLRVVLDPRVICCHVDRDGLVIKPRL